MMSARYDKKTGELRIHGGDDPMTVYRRLGTYLQQLSDGPFREMGAAIERSLQHLSDRKEADTTA